MKTLNYFKTVIITILITTNVAQAQIAIGAKIGLNGSTQAEIGQLYYNNDFKLGSQAGLLLDYRFHSIFSVQLEGNYISKGCKTNINENNSDNKDIRTIEYINIPLLLKARFDNELDLKKNYRVFAYAGPYYSSLISVSDEIDSGENPETLNTEDQVEEYDLGISFGGGVTYLLKTRNEIFIDLRYDMGLSEIVSTDNRLRNKTIGLSIGYRFN